MGPANLPPAIAVRLASKINNVIRRPDATAQFNEMGLEVVGTTPEQFAAHVNSEVPKLAARMRAAVCRLAEQANPACSSESRIGRHDRGATLIVGWYACTW